MSPNLGAMSLVYMSLLAEVPGVARKIMVWAHNRSVDTFINDSSNFNCNFETFNGFRWLKNVDGALSLNETILNHFLVLKLDVRLLRSQIGHGRTDGTLVFYIYRLPLLLRDKRYPCELTDTWRWSN